MFFKITDIFSMVIYNVREQNVYNFILYYEMSFNLFCPCSKNKVTLCLFQMKSMVYTYFDAHKCKN